MQRVTHLTQEIAALFVDLLGDFQGVTEDLHREDLVLAGLHGDGTHGFAVGGMMPTFVTLASQSVANITSTLLAFLFAAIAIFIAGALIVPETRGNM